MIDKDVIADLLIQWEELFEQGQEIPVEKLCRDCPDFVPAVTERIAALKRMAWINRQSQGPGQKPPVGEAQPSRVEIGLHSEMATIAGYRLIQRLGKGAFGEVWSAQSPEGLVAIKFIHGSLRASDAIRHAALELEGLNRIKEVVHPLVLSVFHLEVKNDTLMIVTELADASLEDHATTIRVIQPLLRRCAYTICLLRDAAEALDYAQERHQLLHLDIKPANLMMVSERCKIGDFGTVSQIPYSSFQRNVALSAPSIDNPDDTTTTVYSSFQDVPWERATCRGATLFTGQGAFTPYFAPPEAFQGKVSRTFDQYSLALTFCELIANKLPFSGSGNDQLNDRMNASMEMGFLPAPLRPIIEQALSPQPDFRFLSCIMFVNEMRGALWPLTENDNEARKWLQLAKDRDELATQLAKDRNELATLGLISERHGSEPGWAKLEALTKLIDFSPSFEYYLERAKTYESIGAVGRAWDDYDHAIRLNPTDVRAYQSRGLWCLDSGHYSKAIDDYTHLIRLRPLSSWYYRNRSQAYLSSGQYDRAIEDSTELIRLQLNERFTDPFHLLSFDYFFRGEAYARKGEFDRAIEDFTEAIRLSPERHLAYLKRGEVYSSLGLHILAIEDFTHAIQRGARSDEGVFAKRGLVYLKVGQHELANKDFAQIRSLIPEDLKGLTDARLKELVPLLKNATSLYLVDTEVTDSGAKALAPLANLTTLDLSGTQITNAGLTELNHLKNLTTLHLPERVTDEGLKELAGHDNLTTLYLGDAVLLEGKAVGKELTDARLKGLIPLLKNLTTLDLSETEVTDVGLRELAPLTNLTTLFLPQFVTDVGLRALSALTNLTTLFAMESVTDASLKELAPLANLTTLFLAWSQVTDAGLKELASLTNLMTLHLSGTRITNAGLEDLAPLIGLVTLDLAETQVTDAGLKAFAAFAKLTTLDLSFAQITNAGLMDLTSLSNLTMLDLHGTNVTNGGVAELQRALPNCHIIHGNRDN